MTLPRFLYRGDSDPHLERKLKEYWGSGFFLTNLSNSGSGREIFRQPLVTSVRRHVDAGWAKTHFLSFSASHEVARAFASGRERRSLIQTSTPNWDAAVIFLNCSLLSPLQPLEPGIYRSSYQGRQNRGLAKGLIQVLARAAANQGQVGRTISILLVDVRTYLDHQASLGVPDLGSALEKVRLDQEWLVLPIDTGPEIPGEFTAMLDDGCITESELFRFADPCARE